MRTSNLTTILALLVGALVSPSPVIAQDTTGTGVVAGVVFGGDGKPAAGITICIVGTGRCATSDSAGAFRVREHPRRASSTSRCGRPKPAAVRERPRRGARRIRRRAWRSSLPQIDGVTESVTVTAPAFTPPEEVKTSGLPAPRRGHPAAGRGAAGRVALRAVAAGRRHRIERLPQRPDRPRRQPAREPVRRGQHRDPEHQRLRDLRVGRRVGRADRRRR